MPERLGDRQFFPREFVAGATLKEVYMGLAMAALIMNTNVRLEDVPEHAENLANAMIERLKASYADPSLKP